MNIQTASITMSSLPSPPPVARQPGESQRCLAIDADHWSLPLLQRLEWKRFREACEKFFRLKGIGCEPAPARQSHGFDLRLHQAGAGIPTAGVLCKPWAHPRVGEAAIQEILGMMAYEQLPKGFVITTGRFNADAVAAAGNHGVTLIDGSMFLDMIQRMPAVKREQLLIFATRGDYATPSCPVCDRKMRKVFLYKPRVQAWKCTQHPLCRLFMLTPNAME